MRVPFPFDECNISFLMRVPFHVHKVFMGARIDHVKKPYGVKGHPDFLSQEGHPHTPSINSDGRLGIHKGTFERSWDR